MASSKPRASLRAVTPSTESTSSEETSVARMLDSKEPLVTSLSSSPCVQVLDSSDQVSTIVPYTDADVNCSRAAIAATTPEMGVSADLPALSQDGVGWGPLGSSSSGRRVTYNVEQIRSQWNMWKLFNTLDTDAQCIQFAEEQGLIPRKKMCNYHKRPMSLRTTANTGQVGVFRCTKSNCRNKTESRAKGTWFENAHIALRLIFHIMYMFSHNYSYVQVQRETSRENEPVLSSSVIADWYSYCREAIVVYELEHTNAQGKIGGPGNIVQINKAKYVKRKCNRGRYEDHWILSIKDDGSDDLRLEVCPDNDSSADTLLSLVQKHVEEGSEIHTDFWSAYDCLPQHGYIQKKGAQTKRINNHWRNLFDKDQYKGNFTDRIIAYSWRRKIRIEHKDPFAELVKTVKYVYKIK